MGLLVCAAWTGGGAALAQQIISTSEDFASNAQAVQEAVPNQRRPEFEPIGIRLGQFLSFGDDEFAAKTASDPTLAPLRPGEDPQKSTGGLRDSQLDSFLLRPELEADLVFDDNLFRVDQNTDSTTFYVLRPTLTLDSDWLNHAVSAQVGGEFGRHPDFKDEDFDDYFLSLAPRIDIDEHTILNLELAYESTHVARGSTDDQLEGPEPSIDNTLNAHADWQYQSDKYSTHLVYDFVQLDADDNGPIERDFLDYDSHTWVFRQGYEFAPGTTAWLQPGLELVDYRLSRDDNGLVRDNQGWTLLAGLTFDRSAVSFLELGLGVLTREFEQQDQDDYVGLLYEGRLLWNITPLISMEFVAGRTAEVVESASSPLSVDDSIQLSLAWDPRENLIFSAQGRFTHSEFESRPGESKEEDLVEFSVNVKYLVNSNVSFLLGYGYEQLNSSQTDSDYKANQFGLRAVVQL